MISANRIQILIFKVPVNLKKKDFAVRTEQFADILEFNL